MLYVQIKNINSKNNIIELPVREADPEPINLEKIRKEIYKEPKDAYIEENPFERIKINSKMFRKVKKPTSQTQVFLTDEIPKIVCDMVRRLQNNPENTSPLAVLLDFELE